MIHWHISSTIGFAMTGQYRPVCSLSQSLPPCALRRAFERRMDRAFGDPGHCRKINVIYVVGKFLNEWLLRDSRA